MIPNLFSKLRIPGKIPKGMLRFIDKNKHLDKRKFLEKAFLLVAKRYKPARHMTFFKILDLWITDVDRLWHLKGHMHCQQLNYLIRILLVRSGKFRDSDIKFYLTNTYYLTLHQYMSVNVRGKKIFVDPWYYRYGLDFGDHGHGYHVGGLFAPDDRK